MVWSSPHAVMSSSIPQSRHPTPPLPFTPCPPLPCPAWSPQTRDMSISTRGTSSPITNCSTLFYALTHSLHVLLTACLSSALFLSLCFPPAQLSFSPSFFALPCVFTPLPLNLISLHLSSLSPSLHTSLPPSLSLCPSTPPPLSLHLSLSLSRGCPLLGTPREV